jgi:hypothetical protein
MSRTSQICILITLALSSFDSQAQKRGVPPSSVSPGRSATHNSAPVSLTVAPAAPPNAVPVNAVPSSQLSANKTAAPAAVDAKDATPPAASKSAPDVPDNATVITLHGLCNSDADKTADPQSCTMTVTRDEFDDVLSAVSLGGQVFSPGAIRNVADTYVQNLILANAALKSGVDKDPRVQKLLELVRNRTLAEAYRHAAEEKYRNPSAEEIDKYYRANVSLYEVVKADRLFIPKFNPKSPKDNGDFQKKAEALAAELRDRAAKGEPTDKLQNEAFMKLGIPAPAFLPENGMRRRSSFPSDVVHDVFSLKPGEVTKIENEKGGYALYRMITRDTWTMDQVRGEITRDIFRQKMEADIQGVLQSVKAEMNQQYFAPAITQQPAALPTLQPGKAVPPNFPGSRAQSTHSVKLPPASTPK